MNRRKIGIPIVALIVLGVFGVASYAIAGGSSRDASARLIGYQETPAISTGATAKFTAEIENNNTIDFRVEYKNLEGGNPTQAHIHFGQKGVAGGVSAFFCGGAPPASTKPACPAAASGVVTGTIVAADVIGPTGQGIAAGQIDELIAAMKAGITYANIHNATFPNGEIRGQVRVRDHRRGHDDRRKHDD